MRSQAARKRKPLIWISAQTVLLTIPSQGRTTKARVSNLGAPPGNRKEFRKETIHGNSRMHVSIKQSYPVPERRAKSHAL